MQVRVLFGSGQREMGRLVDLAIRRARFALRRLVAFNPRVRVELEPAGASSDKRCRVMLETDASSAVFATATAVDWCVALDQALTRAVRRLQAALRRATERRLRALPVPRMRRSKTSGRT